MHKKQRLQDAMTRRGLDFVSLGMMVSVQGDIGTIVGSNDSGNLEVVFANQLKMGRHAHNCHPTWAITYYGRDGKVVRSYE